LRAARHETLIGLLAVTGMRPGEAIGLDRADVDLQRGVVHVRAGKQKKQREVPLHETTISALGDYARQRDAHFPTPSTPAFFIGARGRRMGREELNRTFTLLADQIGVQCRGARQRPRPHELRHSLAVHTLIDWHRAGEDIDRRMPLLSALLGHYAGDRVKRDARERDVSSADPASAAVSAIVRRVGEDVELLRLTNRHASAPAMLEERPGRYLGYFENKFGEQLVFVHDDGEPHATVFLGDGGWEPRLVSNASGLPDVGELILNDEERAFVTACWIATAWRREAGR
ncbi:MAG: tyrosine-type recombinase/integrase, partial [Gaiellaceae bacterium]